MLYAVVVGINTYRDPEIGHLRYARADAETFAQLLNDRIDPSQRTVYVVLDREATKRNIMVVIGERLARLAGPEDIVLLYFACHGSPETESSPDQVSRYLVAHDTEFQNVYASGIDMERELPRWYQRIGEPRLVLLFIDACFSGRAGGRTFEGAKLRAIRAGLRSLEPISLSKLDLGEGRLMIAACDDHQVAIEDTKLGHGSSRTTYLKS